MHICGMDFSSLASYWQIKALLMLEPSVVTPQNQYFPANSERMSVHCLESGCIGKYTHLGPRDFPRVGILHPSALEIALGLRPRAISRASGCKIPALGKSLGPRGVYFPIHPSSRQCTDTLSIDWTFQQLILGEILPFGRHFCKNTEISQALGKSN